MVRLKINTFNTIDLSHIPYLSSGYARTHRPTRAYTHKRARGKGTRRWENQRHTYTQTYTNVLTRVPTHTHTLFPLSLSHTHDNEKNEPEGKKRRWAVTDEWTKRVSEKRRERKIKRKEWISCTILNKTTKMSYTLDRFSSRTGRIDHKNKSCWKRKV